MPHLKHSTYAPPNFLFKNADWNTIFSSQLRKLPAVNYHRERLKLPDGDFIDLDWLNRDAPRLALLCHGLEGSSESRYIKGMARHFSDNGWATCAYNYRGCSGETNRLLRAYHSGATDDLALVLQHIFKQNFTEIVLIGFSLGGNLVLKYAGEQGKLMPSRIKKVVAISTPCHLESSSDQIHTPRNWLYRKRFMLKLKQKIALKKDLLQQQGFDYETLLNAQTFHVFDELFTAKAHGFDNRRDYYTKSSSLQFLPSIAVPTLLLNAKDDSFLSPLCYPVAIAENHEFLHLEMPEYGGHVGFASHDREGIFWSERRTFAFCVEGI